MADELQSTPPPAPTHGARIEEIVLVLLVVLSGVGVVFNDYATPQAAFRVWLWLTPVFGLVSTVAAWSRAQRRGEPVAAIVPTQVVHWLGVLGAVLLIYVLQAYGRMESEAAGSAVLVLLALATFLAGVYTDWRLSVLGVVLGVTVVGFAYVERVALVVVPLLLIAIIGLVIYMRRQS